MNAACRFARSIADNSQAGIRFSGFAGGVNFTLAYLYGRWNGDDGSNSAFIKADLNPVTANQALANNTLPATYYVPYTNTIGGSANYFEEYTGAVLRTEMVYIFGVPFNSGDKRSPLLPQQLFGTVLKDMWQGMVGFDRPTWIRWLNKNSTWLILGHGPRSKADRAAATARLISSAWASATVTKCSSVDGEVTEMVAPLLAATHSPSIKNRSG